MTTFYLVLIAAAFWVVVIVAFVIVRRRSSGPPDKTISEFGRSQETLASVTPEGDFDESAPDPAAQRLIRSLQGDLDEPDEGDRHGADALLSVFGPGEDAPAEPAEPVGESSAMEPPATTGESWIEPASPTPSEDPPITPEGDASAEEEEVASLLDSISSEAAGKRTRKPSAPKPKHRGPITVGRTTYVLVDDEGRPQLDD